MGSDLGKEHGVVVLEERPWRSPEACENSQWSIRLEILVTEYLPKCAILLEEMDMAKTNVFAWRSQLYTRSETISRYCSHARPCSSLSPEVCILRLREVSFSPYRMYTQFAVYPGTSKEIRFHPR